MLASFLQQLLIVSVMFKFVRNYGHFQVRLFIRYLYPVNFFVETTMSFSRRVRITVSWMLQTFKHLLSIHEEDFYFVSGSEYGYNFSSCYSACSGKKN